ncbi:MAG: CRISPR-associated helicase Cas3' [Candidatus Cloacimonetes bacterium]|nr:CRISPR-associated helicase Cas3' [Candidatus Cloacimonadota bacterium]
MIYAKSDKTTLLQHIEDCVSVFSSLRKTVPLIVDVAKLPDFWDLLFVAIYFHDFGKAHKEFQKMILNEENVWQSQRHECYSIPFVDKVETDNHLIIKMAILAHHKCFKKLKGYLKDRNTIDFEFVNKWKNIVPFHPEDYDENLRWNMSIDGIKEILSKYESFRQKEGISILLSGKKIKIDESEKPQEIIAGKILHSELWLHIMMWGAMKICDHLGSAHILKMKTLNEKNFTFLLHLGENLKKENKDFYTHQKICFTTRENCILIAPTGTGKTESAMGWLRNQIKKNQGKTFYILPYTASINAMHRRLTSDLGQGETVFSDFVGVQHGKVTEYIFHYFENIDQDILNSDSEDMMNKIKSLYCSIAVPLTVCTPFQVLKYLFGVKGFEKGLVFLAGSKIIFDEIHAYDEIVFAQILVLVEFLREKLKSSVMIMTATLPDFMLKELIAASGTEVVIRADHALLSNLKRHRIYVSDGDIFDNFDKIRFSLNSGKRVIIVCNTVKRAQELYSRISNNSLVPEDEIALIHGRFNQRDRNNIEEKIYNSSTKLLIGTQAIEVSLDIDFDEMFSEPAPLDALLQRFGRINRKALKDLCNITVFRTGGPNDRFVYDENIVNRTLNILESVDTMHEDDIQKMLNTVYPDWEPKQKQSFENTKILFKQSLELLFPYTENKEREEDFYSRFNGNKVLPACLYRDFKNLIEQREWIKADMLLVSITKNKFASLMNREGTYFDHVSIDYPLKSGSYDKKEVLVILCKYNSRLGLTDEHEEIKSEFVID